MTDFNDEQNFGVLKKPAPIVRSMNNNQKHILLAEDDDEMRALLALVLHRAGYNVVTCPD